MIKRSIVRRKYVEPEGSLSYLPEKIQQLYASRGISQSSELEYELKNLLAPTGLKEIDVACEILFDAITRNKKILIVGDFDADGATSSSIMMKGLALLGANNIDFLVPDRFKFGYGLSVKLVEHASLREPDLIVTVDNGIANIEGVAKANELNIPVLVTDHHLAGEQLPDAVAIVNPNQPGCEFESKNLAGVGVAFYLMLALRSFMRNKGWFESQQIEVPNLANLLDIVALGTVADVVPLDRNNRILVEQGLRRIRSGLACPGIKAILHVAGRDETKCQSSDLGFALGPRINAAGRLDDMTVGIECLMAKTFEQALPIAQRLDQLNRSRKQIEQDMLVQANLDIDAFLESNLEEITDSFASESLSEQRPFSLCLFDPEWHQGVIGILASRVKDKINRPVIVFAKDDDSAEPTIKGSARSVKGVHIRDVLAFLDAKHPHLIEKFGGHAMAAGLSIKQKHFQEFAEYFCEAVESHLNGETIKDEVITDGELAQCELSINFAMELRKAGPWGQGFPEPLFDGEFSVVTSRIVGENHLKLIVENQGLQLDAIYFRCPEYLQAQPGERVRIVYKLDINEFRGNISVQMLIEQLEIVD
ncbi:single-stranded-DNA-specific exonuclease RecJ [Aliikangiella sp. G2MR2-5]|uniref:single-stranded-DNA-specific exonuclease RecJ n=1 Tax=Aliikangiella sp. G2MR2-5 TaxID=2788943 RepID=UPI0018A924F9|nr:single-stranded-DNA-specific exonuclease RecJ [Aliikangiella sp. G2MR2-5]